MSPQYGELRPTSGLDRFGSLGHPCNFQWVSRLGSVTARHYSSGRQPNFAALNRERHLYSAEAAITLGIGPHSSFILFLAYVLFLFMCLFLVLCTECMSCHCILGYEQLMVLDESLSVLLYVS